MMKIVVGSRNKGKVDEIRRFLADLPVEVISLPEKGIDEVEETGATFAENAILKATYYRDQTGEACLADDSGLEVDALAGEPGVRSARFAGEDASDEDNNEKLLHLLAEVPTKKRTARFRSVLALVGADGKVLLADGVCEGQILSGPRGEGGFGYDPLFWMPEPQKTLAEMTLDEKNAVSHRGNALRALKEKLVKEFAAGKR